MSEFCNYCPYCENNCCDFPFIDYVFFVDEDKYNFLRKNKNHESEDFKNYPSFESIRICINCIENLNKKDKIIYDKKKDYIFVRKKNYKIIKYLKVVRIKKTDLENYENF